MKNDLSVTLSTEKICSCYSCKKRNYGDQYMYDDNDLKLYDVRIGCLVGKLCEDCLRQLIGEAIVVLLSEK